MNYLHEQRLTFLLVTDKEHWLWRNVHRTTALNSIHRSWVFPSIRHRERKRTRQMTSNLSHLIRSPQARSLSPIPLMTSRHWHRLCTRQRSLIRRHSTTCLKPIWIVPIYWRWWITMTSTKLTNSFEQLVSTGDLNGNCVYIHAIDFQCLNQFDRRKTHCSCCFFS